VSHPSRQDYFYKEINIELTVDVYNDGKTLVYTRKATLTPSLTETVSSWF
jgi:wobble nucleotide-excising tRNase